MGISIQHLIQGQPPLVTVDVNETLKRALELMTQHDFSQLPVLENGKSFGNRLITTESILKRLKMLGASMEELGVLTVRSATVQARTIAVDDDLFSQLETLSNDYSILVTDSHGEVKGIVTNFDTARYFRLRALDMLLAENIETTLKGHLREALRGADGGEAPLKAAVNNLTTREVQNREECRKALTSYCHRQKVPIDEGVIETLLNKHFALPKQENSFDKLTLDQYIALARGTEAWSILQPVYKVSRDHFGKMMETMRQTRNKLMHFNPNISADDRDHLRSCSDWYNDHPFELPVKNENQPLDPGVSKAWISHGDPVDGVSNSGSSVHYSSRPGAFRQKIQVNDRGLIDLQDAENGASENSLPGEQAVLRLDAISLEEPTPEEVDLIEDESPNEAVTDSVDAKYAPLANFLLKQKKTQDRVVLTFSDIEQIIGAFLPNSAREFRSWWDNNPQARVHSSQWLKVNWRVVSVNMTAQRVTFGQAPERAKTYIEFFSLVQDRVRRDTQFPLFDANPLGINWLPLYKFDCPFPQKPSILLSFAHHHRLRLELYIDCGDSEKNEQIFRFLQQRADWLEEAIGASISWEPLEGKRACRVALYTPGGIDDSLNQREELVQWAVRSAVRFYSVMREPLNLALEKYSKTV